MDKVFEAVVEGDGRIRIMNSVRLEKGSKVIVSVSSDEQDSVVREPILSQDSLAADWLNAEEDHAWSHLQ